MGGGLQRGRRAGVAVAAVLGLAAAAVGVLGISWASSQARVEREGSEKRLLGELRAAAADAGRALAGAVARTRRGEEPGFAVERFSVVYRPEATPPGLGEILAGAERLEYVEGRPGAARKKYRELLDGTLLPTERVTALRNVARLDLAAGEEDRALAALEEATAVRGASDEQALLAAFELARLRGREIAPLLDRIERGEFPAVPPRRRAFLHQDLGGDPDRVAGLLAAARFASAADPDELVEIAGGRLAWRTGTDPVRIELVTATVRAVLDATLRGHADALFRRGEGGTPLPPPFRELEVVPGAGGEAEVERAAARAFRQRAALALAAGAVLLLAGGLLFFAERRRAQMDRRRTDFLWAVTHDLKTPIANIMLYAETIRTHGAEDPEGAERFSGIIGEEAERLLAKVQSVLDVAAGRRALSSAREGFDAGAALESVVAEHRRGAETQGVEIDLELPGEGVTLEGSDELFSQAVGGLLDNAVKFAASRVAVRLSRDDGIVRVRVEDDGEGIPESRRPTVFRPSERPSGAGVGLALVRHCVESGGGRVSAGDSDWGGACMTVEYGR